MFCAIALRQKCCMAKTDFSTTMMSAIALPAPTGEAAAPEWVHLLPAGQIGTADKRGPYHVTDADQIIRASFQHEEKVPVDINHAIYLKGPKGEEAPAVGWVTEMDARDDGIWGKVEWTAHGAELVSSRAYRGISPVINHTDAKEITSIPCVSLVNKPNLRGLTALHQEETEMNLREQIIKMLGLKDDASDEDILKSLKAKKDDAGTETALQSALGEIGVALGLKDDADPADIVTAAKAKPADAAPAEITALQSEISNLTNQLNEVTDGQKRDKAEAYIDGEIKKGRVGLKPVRDRYVSMHMRDAEETTALIEAMPILGNTATSILPPETTDGNVSLNSEQLQVAKQLGMSAEDYAKELKSETSEEIA